MIVSETMMTGYPGLFAGGDMVPSERTVTTGVGHGKKAARNIDAICEERRTPSPNPTRWRRSRSSTCGSTPGRPEAARTTGDPPSTRGLRGDRAGPLGEDATYEAKRCLSCGNCFECDGCFAACPEDAIIKLGPKRGYEIDFDLCTGCAICFEQCPCHAIEMIPEPRTE